MTWSGEFSFDRKSIREKAICDAGVYKLLQAAPYPRYVGMTRVLYIGSSQGNVQEELLRLLQGPHTNRNRLARVLLRSGSEVTFKFLPCGPLEAVGAEKRLLREFEDEHWDLPALNSQRGYTRDGDKHYREATHAATE